MKEMADFFTSVQGFFLSAFGSGVIGWLLSYPAHQQTQVNGAWTTCGELAGPQCNFGSLRWTNYFGGDAFADHAAQATVLAVVIGVAFGGLALLAGAVLQKQA